MPKAPKIVRGEVSNFIKDLRPRLYTTDLRDRKVIGHKIRVLIYDLLYHTKRPECAKRMQSALKGNYLSPPYFTQDEAEIVSNAIISVHIRPCHLIEGPDGENRDKELTGKKTVGQGICFLSRLYIKRKKYGLAVGLHPLAEMYAALFGVDLEEFEDEYWEMLENFRSLNI